MKILVFGLPGSGKTTLSNKIAQKLGATHLNADRIRQKYRDWDFSNEGRKRQALRMNKEANNSKTQFVILDFICPKKEYRDLIKPDIIVYMDTIKT